MTAVVAPGRKMGCSKLNFTNITTSSLATDSRRVSVKEYIAVQEHSQFPDQYDQESKIFYFVHRYILIMLARLSHE